MKEQTIIDITVKDRRGAHLVTIDRIQGLTPNSARDLIEKKYSTAIKEADKKILNNLLKK